MTATEAQKILNENGSGKVYSLKEAGAYLDLCFKLAEIFRGLPQKKKPTSNLKVA